MLSQISAVFTRLLRVGLYTAVYASGLAGAAGRSPCLLDHLARLAAGAGLLRLLLLLAAPHGTRGGRAVGGARGAPPEPGLQPVHRAAPDQQRRACSAGSSTCRWPLAGVPPLVFGIVALVDLLYQYWVHTEHVPKLGWFDRWFCSPSNHRVHHAVNDNYLDKNYGGILIVWDRLFGTFQRRRPGRALRLWHTWRAQQLGPAVGERRGLLGAGEGCLAHPQLGRQIARLAQATGLAAGRRGGSASRRPAFDMARVQRFEPAISPTAAWGSPA
jgi:alkylglycerol monooxygenase